MSSELRYRANGNGPQSKSGPSSKTSEIPKRLNPFAAVKPKPVKGGRKVLNSSSTKDASSPAANEDDSMNLREFISTEAGELFMNSIPLDSIKALPPKYMYFFGALAIISIAIMFGAFYYSAIKDSLGSRFLSIGAPSDTNNHCEDVAKSVSLTLLASDNGLWESSVDFKYTNAFYSVTLLDFVGTSAEFKTLMNDFSHELKPFGNLSSNYVYGYNLIMWSSLFLQINRNSKRQTLQLTGAPSIIFSVDGTFGAFANRNGNCSAVLDSSFNPSLNSFSMTLSKDYVQANCPSFIRNFQNSTGVVTNTQYLNVFLDAASMMTAMAVSLNFLDVDLLSPLVYESGTFTTQYASKWGIFVVSRYIDPRYVGMMPIYCSVKKHANSSSPFCFIKDIDFAVPILLNSGSERGIPSRCTCPSAANEANCNIIDLFTGAIVFESIYDIFEMQSKYTFHDFNELSYNAAYVTISGYLPTSITASIINQTFIEDAFKFCETSSRTNCTSYTWYEHAFSSNSVYAQTVSEYYYQLFNGSCRDTVNLAPTDFEALASNPPVKLEEDFVNCKNGPLHALFYATGIAQGNVGVAMPFALGLMLPVLFIMLKIIGYVPPRIEYTEEEKNLALNELALQIVRIRDGKTRAIKKNMLIYKLANELLKIAQEPAGYPDSDDEQWSSDEDEGDSDDEEEGNHKQQQYNQKQQSSSSGKAKNKLKMGESQNQTRSSSNINSVELTVFETSDISSSNNDDGGEQGIRQINATSGNGSRPQLVNNPIHGDNNSNNSDNNINNNNINNINNTNNINNSNNINNINNVNRNTGTMNHRSVGLKDILRQSSMKKDQERKRNSDDDE